MSKKMTQLKSLSELTAPQYSRGVVKLVAPNGDEFEVNIKLIVEGETRSIRKEVIWPTAPMDLVKGPDGVRKVYDEGDPKFREALELANRDFAFRLLIRSLDQTEIPGDTIEAKMAFLSDTLGGWVLAQLLDQVPRLSGVSPAVIEQRANEIEANPLSS